MRRRQITSSSIREQFPEVADEVKFNKDRVIVTRRGKELVAIIPIEDLETLEAAEDFRDLEEGRKALKKAKKEGTISWEAFKDRTKS